MLQLLIVMLMQLALLLLLQSVVEEVQLEVEQPHEVAPVAAAAASAVLALPDQPVMLLLRADRHLGQRGQLLLVLLPHAARRWGR